MVANGLGRLKIGTHVDMLGGAMVDTHEPPHTLRELLGWPTLVVAGLMLLLWLGLAAIIVVTVVSYSGDPYFWEGVSFILWEFSWVLIIVGTFGTAVTLATYGITTMVRRTRTQHVLSA